MSNSDQVTDTNDSPAVAAKPKQAWRPPTLEEVDYTATEVSGLPGVFYDGIGSYSTP